MLTLIHLSHLFHFLFSHSYFGGMVQLVFLWYSCHHFSFWRNVLDSNCSGHEFEDIRWQSCNYLLPSTGNTIVNAALMRDYPLSTILCGFIWTVHVKSCDLIDYKNSNAIMSVKSMTSSIVILNNVHPHMARMTYSRPSFPVSSYNRWPLTTKTRPPRSKPLSHN